VEPIKSFSQVLQKNNKNQEFGNRNFSNPNNLIDEHVGS